MRACSLLEGGRNQGVEEESQEAGEGRRRRAGLRESLVVAVAAVEGSPELVEQRTCLGNLEAVVEPPLRLLGNQAEAAAREGADVMAKVLHDRLISRCLSVIDAERTCAPWRRTLRHRNIIVCIFFLFFSGHAWGRALRHGNIVVCVLCVDTFRYSGI